MRRFCAKCAWVFLLCVDASYEPLSLSQCACTKWQSCWHRSPASTCAVHSPRLKAKNILLPSEVVDAPGRCLVGKGPFSPLHLHRRIMSPCHLQPLGRPLFPLFPPQPFLRSALAALSCWSRFLSSATVSAASCFRLFALCRLDPFPPPLECSLETLCFSAALPGALLCRSSASGCL